MLRNQAQHTVCGEERRLMMMRAKYFSSFWRFEVGGEIAEGGDSPPGPTEWVYTAVTFRNQTPGMELGNIRQKPPCFY